MFDFFTGSTFVKYLWSLDVTVILLCLQPYWTNVIPGLEWARFKILLKNLLVIRKIPSCCLDRGFPGTGRESQPRCGLWLSFCGQLFGCGGVNNAKPCDFRARHSHVCAYTYHPQPHTQVSARHMKILLFLCWVIKSLWCMHAAKRVSAGTTCPGLCAVDRAGTPISSPLDCRFPCSFRWPNALKILLLFFNNAPTSLPNIRP